VPGRVTRADEQGENMDETQDQSMARPASPGEHDGHRRPVRGKMWELEGRWLMGRVAPR
jgi:hypothetical protein